MKASKWEVFKILFSMHLLNYKKDLYGIFSGWIVTTLTLILWLTFKNTQVAGSNADDLVVDEFLAASAIAIGVIRNCLYNFTKTVYDFKNARFFDKLFSTQISKTFVFSSMIFFNQVVNIFVVLFMFGLTMLFPDQRETINHINWPIFLLGFVLLAFSSNLIALLIVFCTKKSEWALVIANLFYYLPMYLLGLGIPWTLIERNTPIIIIGYFLPQRYFLNIMAWGWVGKTKMTQNQFGYNGNYWIPFVVSISILLILIVSVIWLFYKKFEQENKKFLKYSNTMKHMAIIYNIRKANSIEELNEIMDIKKLTSEIKQKRRQLKGIKRHERKK